MRYLILGAGWYGCYLGMIFKLLGLDFVILEKEGDIFQGASSKNQNRLHQGYHYPRSKETRDECQKGYAIFNKLFGYMTMGVLNNYYVIDKTSKTSYADYIKTYQEEGYQFDIVQTPFGADINMDKVAGIIRCSEKVIDHQKAKLFFKRFLEGNIIYNCDMSKLDCKTRVVYDSVEYGYLINCTYGQALTSMINIEYEACLSLIYRSKNTTVVDYSITVMDGNYFSIYPYCGTNKFTLTDVENTPIFKSPSFTKVSEFAGRITDKLVANFRTKMEKKVMTYIPTFNKLFEYDSHNLSFKCKIKNGSDDRSLKSTVDGKVINFIGGKITGIFSMVESLFGKIDELRDINSRYLQKDSLVVRKILSIFKRGLTEKEVSHHSTHTKPHVLDFVMEVASCNEFVWKYCLPTLKIAVCFFGYTRDMEANYKTHQKLLDLKPDIFIHTFQSSGKKSEQRFKGGDWIKPEEMANIIDVNFLKEKYKPKNIMVEQNELEKFAVKGVDGLIPLLVYQAHDNATKYINSQLYTKKRVCELKQEYERANGIVYDIVILTRFDFGYSVLNIKDILSLDMAKIYFPGYNSRHAHPGGGGGCKQCDAGKFHFGESHSNDMCDLWAISCSTNIDLLCRLYDDGKNILINTLKTTGEIVAKRGIKNKVDEKGGFLYVYERFEEPGVVCYYPERLLREYLTRSVCLTYNGIHGRINIAIN